MRLAPHLSGAAEIQRTATGTRLLVQHGDATYYRNAQLDDYAGLRRVMFPHRPPLRLNVRARFSHGAGNPQAPSLLGTAGFGFWNDPFMMTDPRPPMLPRALWFFYASPPSDMRLTVETPGWGWKAVALDALRASVIGPALAAPLLIPLMRFSSIYRRVWPAIERRLRIAEAGALVRLTDWHAYCIEWGWPPDVQRARFSIDDVLLLDAPAPTGPLGLVIWCDNQYLVAQPWGRFAHGLLATEEQWLEIADLSLERPGARALHFAGGPS